MNFILKNLASTDVTYFNSQSFHLYLKRSFLKFYSFDVQYHQGEKIFQEYHVNQT
jgi:hypothetical protein